MIERIVHNSTFYIYIWHGKPKLLFQTRKKIAEFGISVACYRIHHDYFHIKLWTMAVSHFTLSPIAVKKPKTNKQKKPNSAWQIISWGHRVCPVSSLVQQRMLFLYRIWDTPWKVENGQRRLFFAEFQYLNKQLLEQIVSTFPYLTTKKKKKRWGKKYTYTQTPKRWS